MRREGEGWSLYRGAYPGRPGGATGPPAATVGRPSGGRPWAGRQAPVAPPPTGDWAFFFSRDFVANLEREKITLWACRPMGGRPGYIFEIFENGHIFLIFFKYKKEKTTRNLLTYDEGPRVAG